MSLTTPIVEHTYDCSLLPRNASLQIYSSEKSHHFEIVVGSRMRLQYTGTSKLVIQQTREDAGA